MFDSYLLDLFTSAPFFVSLIAGILTFLSPCILPLIPAYMSYISGESLEELKNGNVNKYSIFFKSLLFVIGFGIIFILIGGAAANIIQNYLNGEWMNYVSGIVIIIFGLHFLGIFRISFLYKIKKSNFDIKTQNKFLSFLTPFIFGVSFALGWTPCIGPIFSTIALYAGSQQGFGTALVVVYTLGLAIPFLVVGLLINKALGVLNSIKKHSRKIEIISGLLLVIIGIMILTGAMRDLSQILINYIGV